MVKQRHEPRPAMTLGNMREQGVRIVCIVLLPSRLRACCAAGPPEPKSPGNKLRGVVRDGSLTKGPVST
jgi:hypothetical protein